MSDLLELTRYKNTEDHHMIFYLDVTQDRNERDTTTLVIPLTYNELRQFQVMIENMLNGRDCACRLEVNKGED